jgi:hypothetical protein
VESGDVVAPVVVVPVVVPPPALAVSAEVELSELITSGVGPWSDGGGGEGSLGCCATKVLRIGFDATGLGVIVSKPVLTRFSA